jgi:hypothetical protein
MNLRGLRGVDCGILLCGVGATGRGERQNMVHGWSTLETYRIVKICAYTRLYECITAHWTLKIFRL